MKLVKKLAIATSGGAVLCFGIAQWFRNQIANQIKNSELYKDAMDAVKQHKGVIYYIGLPIQEDKPHFINSGYFSSSSNVKVKISGPKSDGLVFISVIRGENYHENINDVVLDSIQLQIGRDDGRRLIVKPSSIESNSKS